MDTTFSTHRMRLLECVLVCMVFGSLNAQGLDLRGGQTIQDAFLDHNLFYAIQDPIGVEFVDGYNWAPAYKFSMMSDIKAPHILHLPQKLYEFVITSFFRPITRNGGYLFSIVNPEETIVQLGIHLTPALLDKWNITLLYTNADSQRASKKLATFEIPYSNNWQTVAFKILFDQVKFYHNCIEVQSVMVKREPIELIFDSASTLYLGQAGRILKGHFEDFISGWSGVCANLPFKKEM